MSEVQARPRRTLAEWEALQVERAKIPPPEVHGHEGKVKATVKTQAGLESWQAPSVAELEGMGLKLEIRYRRRRKTNIHKEDIQDWQQAKPDDYIKKRYKTYAAYKKNYSQTRLLNKGGSTWVRLFTTEGRFAEAVVYCHANDNFSKKVGYVLAVNRALEALQR